ncbi:MAG TPA: bifunctional serine/threonine-protein kinase/ABC transporter substrate-binding protein, partial [Kofleriaceae bacterium]
MPTPGPSEQPSLAPPAAPDGVLGRYRLFAKLGSGGQADIYLAIARGTLGVDKLVVIKRARPAADAAVLGIFLDEARLALRLNHPNLVHGYEVGEDRGTHFLAMEHVEGLSLRELFRAPRARSFGPAIWLRVVADALSGLAHAHGLRDYDGKPLGVVHRDISPHNILVSYDGVTKLLDFGIALTSHGAAPDAAVAPASVLGKVWYMAPEQARGQIDHRSDLFAMGVVLWEMLAGRRLFEGDAAAVLHRLAHEPVPRLAGVLPGVDPELDGLVARALEKDPAARFQTAHEMRQAIERYLRKAGHVVRELEVGEAMAAAFHDVRAELQARIRHAMASLPGDPPQNRNAGEIREAPDSLASPTTRPAVHPSLAAAAALATAAVLVWIAARTPRRGDVAGGRGAAIVAPIVAPVVAAKVALAPRAPCPGPIRVRVMYDMTGDTKEVGTAAGKGEYDYLRAIDAAGGIGGCRLDIDVQDTHYDKRASLEVWGAWRARPDWPEVSTIFLQGTPMTQLLGPLAAADGKVILSGAYAGELAAAGPTAVDVAVPSLSSAFAEASVLVRKQSPGYPSVFFQGTDYTTAARVAANFAWRQGARRMAFFYCSTSAFCTDPVDGAKTFLQQLGGTRVGRDLFLELGDDAATIERKVSRFFQEELRHKATHPDYDIADWIWFGNTSPNAASLGKALDKARAQYGIAVHVIGNNWSVDESLYDRCGDACVGFHVVQPFALFGDPTAAGTAGLLADHARHRALDGDPPGAYKTVQYVYGRVAVATWKLAVARLLERGEPVTGANLRDMLEGFRNVDVEGFATIGYTRADHRPQSGARITRLGPHGRMETIGQPLSLSLQS